MRANPFQNFDFKTSPLRVLTYNTHLFKGSTAPVGAVITSVASQNILNLGFGGAYQKGLDRVLYDDQNRGLELAKYLRNSGAHIIGLQEVWSSEMVHLIETQLSDLYTYTWSPAKAMLDLKVSSGLLLLSRFPIFDTKITKYSHLHGDCSWANKGVASATVQIPCGGFLLPLRMVMTHAGTDVGGPSLPHMKTLAESVSDIKYPSILLGDFNVNSAAYDLMDSILASQQCKDTYKTVHPSLGSQGDTVDLQTNKLDQFFRAIPGSLESGADRIDYQYFKQGLGFKLVPVTAKVFRDWKYHSSTKRDRDEEMDVSDHYPLQCEYQLEVI